MLRSTLIATALLVAAHGASAREAAPKIVVPHADLDLSKPTGQARLDRRVRNAAATLCPAGSLDLRARLAMFKCRELAAATAENQVSEAVLAAGGERSPARLAGARTDDRS